MTSTPQNVVDALSASARKSQQKPCYVAQVLARTFSKPERDAIKRHRTNGMSLAELERVLDQFGFHVGTNGFNRHFNRTCRCR